MLRVRFDGGDPYSWAGNWIDWSCVTGETPKDSIDAPWELIFIGMVTELPLWTKTSPEGPERENGTGMLASTYHLWPNAQATNHTRLFGPGIAHHINGVELPGTVYSVRTPVDGS